VENKLFRVPKAIFEQSEAFQDMFSVPQAENEAVEGSDDEHPLVLEGYLAHDFKQLLRVLLPLYVGFDLDGFIFFLTRSDMHIQAVWLLDPLDFR
jgi:hypothetical protein